MAQQILTYNQILAVLQDIANRHYQLNGNMRVVQVYDRAIEKNTPMPMLYVRPIEGTFIEGEEGNQYPVKELKFELAVLDLVDKGLENENDVHSDTHQVLSDIITEITQHPYYAASLVQLAKDIKAKPLFEESDDDAYGWSCQILFRLLNHTEFCGLPFYPIPNFVFSGTSYQNIVAPISYLTCSNVTACTTLQNYVQEVVSTATTTSSSFAVANGINTFTGGSTSLTSVNITGLTINNITVSGASSFQVLSATTLISGATNLSNIFAPIGLITGVASVGSTGNLITGNTAANPVLSIVGSPNFSSINVSGQTTTNSLSGTSLSGTNIYSASTNLNSVFAPANINTGVLTIGLQDLNITSGGTAVNPTIGLSNNISINNLTSSGSTSLQTLSATTIISGSSNLYSLFQPLSSCTIAVQPGTNITTANTQNYPLVSVVSNPVFTSLSATSMSGTNIYSASTNLNSVFQPLGNYQIAGTYVTSVNTSGSNLSTGGTQTAPVIQLSSTPTFTSLSATSLSGTNIFSGTTNLSSVFAPANINTGVLSVAPYNANIITGGTSVNPTVGIANSPSFAGLTTSAATTINSSLNITGNTTFVGMSGSSFSSTTANFGTILSAGTSLYSIFSTSSSGGGSGITRSVNSISVNTNAGANALTDYVYLISGNTTLTLPTAVSNTNRYTIKNVGAAGIPSATTTSSQTIDGSLSISLPVQYTSLDLISDNSNWNII